MSQTFLALDPARPGMSLAASGGNCTIVFSFAPTAVGTRTSNLTIASNNSGGNVTISRDWKCDVEHSGRHHNSRGADLQHTASRHKQHRSSCHGRQ